MSAQIIERNGRPEWAVIPYEEYQALVEKAELADDLRAFDTGMADESEALPHSFVKRLAKGESPVRVWRAYRQLSQSELAERSDVSQQYLSMLESGRRTGSAKVLKRIAEPLGVDMDDLLPWTASASKKAPKR